MALISNSWTILIYYFLFPVLVSSLSFNFSSFGPGDQKINISVRGDAYITSEGIQVTPNERNKWSSQATGHAIYINPFHLRDNSSGNITDFDTNFTFVVQSENPTCFGDGLAFFLAPFESIPQNSSGKGLGLSNNVTSNASGDPFFAVEFDTFGNQNWDPFPPRTPHVGIDVNSLISAKAVRWPINITVENKNVVWIRYDSMTKNLSVVFTVTAGNDTRTAYLEDVVDLMYLPERVRVGFSAATGDCFEIHNVKSWSFNSKGVNDTNPYISPQAKKMKKAGLVIGLVVGLSVFVLGLILVGYYLWRKRSGRRTEEEVAFDISMEDEFDKTSHEVF